MMSYKKSSNSNYQHRSLRRGQTSVFSQVGISTGRDKFGVHIDKSGLGAPNSVDTWIIRLSSGDALTARFLKRCIEQYGYRKFEEILKRLLVLPMSVFDFSSSADDILSQPLPDATQKNVDKVNLMHLELTGEDLRLHWRIRDAKGRFTFYLPKTGVPD